MKVLGYTYDRDAKTAKQSHMGMVGHPAVIAIPTRRGEEVADDLLAIQLITWSGERDGMNTVLWMVNKYVV